MGSFDALTTAVSGLQAQSFALQNISGDIANSQTTAFKSTNTRFEDFMSAGKSGLQASGTVEALSTSSNNLQGAIQTSSVGTFMAVNGDGYFTVAKPSGVSSTGQPVFNGAQVYTRRGDFQPNKDGFLVNGAGYYLMGSPIDPASGNPTGAPRVLQFNSTTSLPAQATTLIQYRANLAANPRTGSAAAGGTGLLNPADFQTNPIAGAGNGTVVGSDASTFVNESLAGGSVTGNDAAGKPVDIQLRWAKVGSVAQGGADTWNLFYQTNSTATATQAAWQNVGTNFTFSPNGQANPPVGTVPISNLAVDGVSLGTVTLDFGTGGMTQFADPSGAVQVAQLSQNGSPAGQLQDLSISAQGRLDGTFSNGKTVDLAGIPLASFRGEDFLQQGDGETVAATTRSGAAQLNASGKIVGSALEASNTDIAGQFSTMIVTQQAYSANTKVVTTSDQMLRTLTNLTV